MPVIQHSGAQLRHIHGVIFDLDGTLATSNPDFTALRSELNIPYGTDILSHLDAIACDKQRQWAHGVVGRYEMQSAAAADWIPGASELVDYLSGQHLPMAILTRNIRQAAAITLSRLKCPINLLLTREDALPKPSADGIFQICRQWQIPPHNILYVGDYQYDLQAAHDAGAMSLLFCPEMPWPEYAELADWVTDDYLDFIALLRCVRQGA
ncbi:haloacid dehalogenase [Shewanella sp. NFH-SH190041]|uniref:HAD family hydrolase n=1 Tax=Shewanella sp. NFH-SH190041 TaxID=2950245 RepID=UPI0021C2F463|nr:HAD-IA family hydrolase [Shewanella sp. NFH-SH190041]BDM63027.1 haloacid dehalogenase [Shewanella sp. NFH-SH190041]